MIFCGVYDVSHLFSYVVNFDQFFNCFVDLLYFQPIRSPLAPRVLITGIVPSESSIFKSALHPLRLTFRAENGGTCRIIFKKGDDIRQDQLVNVKILLLLRTKS